MSASEPLEAAGSTCIDVAAEFMASQPGATRRALRVHRRRPDGNCAGCGVVATRWPCAVATIASMAELLIARRNGLRATRRCL